MDTLDEITPENPVPRDAPSILSTESALQSAARNDVNNDENEIEMLTMSNKRTFNEDSSEEDTNNPLPAKKAATGSPASEQSGTRVPKGAEGAIYPRSRPSLPKLLNLEDGGPVREISLPHGLPASQIKVRDPRVLLKVAEIVQQ